MKILHVIANPFFTDRGGLVRIYEEIRQASAAGYECHVCCYHFGRSVAEAVIHRTLYIPWYNRLEATASFHRFYLDLLLMIKTLRVVARIKPDIIHAHGHEGVFAAFPASRLYSIPLLMDAQGSLTGEMQAKGVRGASVFSCFEWLLDRRANHIICSSQPVLNEMRDRFHVPADRLSILADGADVRFFSPRPVNDDLMRQVGIPEGAKVVAYLGLLLEHQGIDILLDVAQRVLEAMPEAFFLIMGFPNELHWAAEAERRGLSRVCFTGRVEYSKSPDMLALAHVAVSPKRFGSGEGNGKLLNYMAMSLPVVAFEHPVNRAILGDEGSMVEPENVEQFANSVLDLLQNNEKAQCMGKALRKRVCEEFSMEICAEQLLSVYRRLFRA
jgi:glycosyltransferase involved in cell wall biosynthesis